MTARAYLPANNGARGGAGYAAGGRGWGDARSLFDAREIPGEVRSNVAAKTKGYFGTGMLCV